MRRFFMVAAELCPQMGWVRLQGRNPTSVFQQIDFIKPFEFCWVTPAANPTYGLINRWIRESDLLSGAALGGAGVGCVAPATHAVFGAQATRACRELLRYSHVFRQAFDWLLTRSGFSFPIPATIVPAQPRRRPARFVPAAPIPAARAVGCCRCCFRLSAS